MIFFAYPKVRCSTKQTLEYRAGDCDDLSILYSALLESVGVETAFITDSVELPCPSGKRAWNWACERVGLCHSMNLEVCEWHERTILGTRVR